MKQQDRKFSKHVGHLEAGGLNGWCANCPPDERHRALSRTLAQVGYAKTIERLDYIHNVSNPRRNARTRESAAEDIRWLENERDGEPQDVADDRPRLAAGTHEVAAHPTTTGSGRPSWVRRHRARNPNS